MIALGLVVGDAAAGDAELGGELFLGVPGALAQPGEARSEALAPWGCAYLGMSRLSKSVGSGIYIRFSYMQACPKVGTGPIMYEIVQSAVTIFKHEKCAPRS